MKYILTILLTTSFIAVAQEPALKGYTSVYANYTFCNLNEGATFDDVRPFVAKYVENANSFENNVNLAVLFPMLASNPEHDFFFVSHADTREEMGAFNDKMFEIYTQSDAGTPPMECDVNLEAFQRVGPSSSDADPQGRLIVDYWPCNYKEGFDRSKMREARRKAAVNHYAAGAEGGYRYIMTNSGTDREQDVDFWFSTSAPSEEARGKNIDLWWSEIRNSKEWEEVRKHASCNSPESYSAFPLKQ